MSMPTAEDAGRLVAFLNVFSKPDFQPLEEPASRAPSEPRVIQLESPQYDSAINEFIAIASKEPWRDPDYRANGGGAVSEADLVASASLGQVRAMLTYLIRAERFSEGSLADAVGAGQLQGVLRRLSELFCDEWRA